MLGSSFPMHFIPSIRGAKAILIQLESQRSPGSQNADYNIECRLLQSKVKHGLPASAVNRDDGNCSPKKWLFLNMNTWIFYFAAIAYLVKLHPVTFIASSLWDIRAHSCPQWENSDRLAFGISLLMLLFQWNIRYQLNINRRVCVIHISSCLIAESFAIMQH